MLTQWHWLLHQNSFWHPHMGPLLVCSTTYSVQENGVEDAYQIIRRSISPSPLTVIGVALQEHQAQLFLHTLKPLLTQEHSPISGH